ncbi:unnamed protein product [Ectocarpus sp. 12 AP-2014]
MQFPELKTILNNSNTTCFTDKHKGSDAPVPKICSLTEHRRFVEHLTRTVGCIGPVSLPLQLRLAVTAKSDSVVR